MAYPYLPGSQTDAFKGVSVFLGLMVTFGLERPREPDHERLHDHLLARALRLGDFVRIGDVEGTVTHLGVLSTKVRTLRRKKSPFPTRSSSSQTTTDYSRLGDTDGVFTPTSVTIGYDAPWRQVQALLLLAAERTPGLRREPSPGGAPDRRSRTSTSSTRCSSASSARSRGRSCWPRCTRTSRIVFNEYGVQIMSPNYVLDPAAPKVVPKKDWYAAPADTERPPHTS